MPLIIGLTGGIGSGKTAASDWFAARGITIVDADVVAREVVAVGQPALTEIAARFGAWALNADGTLNRIAMREHVFAHPEDRRALEAITHPRIHASMMAQLMGAASPYVLLVSPLLLESGQAGLGRLCQRILVIDVPEHLQHTRASARDGQTAESIQRIMQVQLPRAERLAQADDVAFNYGDLDHLYQQLEALHQQYLVLAQAQG